ncbi:MAG: HindIII family type II restriction endonuclease [bacterium]|nr:HindIII family type II restriction endonuclease [bacterium]
MIHDDIIGLVERIAKLPNAFDSLSEALMSLSRQEISDLLLTCGIIPENFDHDSSQEKLWAKYGDILFSLALNALNISSQVIRLRGNSADILAQTPDYTLVGDAKAFRMSRTAKNQKDFKISALNDWRGKHTFACLIAPLYQYPTRKSQIYQQAQRHRVLMLSYVHLKFLLDFMPTASLKVLWQLPESLSVDVDASDYWKYVDTICLSLTGQSAQFLADYKAIELDHVKMMGNKSISYWQQVIQQYQQLSQQEAVQRLIKSEKIEQKMFTIRQTIERLTLP